MPMEELHQEKKFLFLKLLINNKKKLQRNQNLSKKLMLVTNKILY